jgi:hypothetical protein
LKLNCDELPPNFTSNFILRHYMSVWKSRVDPAIAMQDSHEQFDMQIYGDRIISRLADGRGCHSSNSHLNLSPSQHPMCSATKCSQQA